MFISSERNNQLELLREATSGATTRNFVAFIFFAVFLCNMLSLLRISEAEWLKLRESHCHSYGKKVREETTRSLTNCVAFLVIYSRCWHQGKRFVPPVSIRASEAYDDILSQLGENLPKVFAERSRASTRGGTGLEVTYEVTERPPIWMDDAWPASVLLDFFLGGGERRSSMHFLAQLMERNSHSCHLSWQT